MTARPLSARLERGRAKADSSFETIFTMSDDDKDGLLDLKEFRKALLQMQEFQGSALQEDDVKEMILEVS